MVDALERPAGPALTPRGFGQRLAGRHPCRAEQFAIAGARSPSCYRANLWSRAQKKVGSNKRILTRGRLHENCTPIPRGADVEFAGRERDRKDTPPQFARFASLEAPGIAPRGSAPSDHGHVNAFQPNAGFFGLWMIRDLSQIRTHSVKCGWRAAQPSMAREMPRSSCWPVGHV